ncbi:MAG: hypothetical protein EA367_13795, partial [Leptolyngbya sp. DLM2.Bin15]
MYAIDPSNDSNASIDGVITVGDTIYEIYGMAIHEDLENNRIWVALNTNLPLEGRVIDELEVPNLNGVGTRFETIAGGSIA